MSKHPPSKKELASRIKRGEILLGFDAVLAAECGLGDVARTMPNMVLVLRPKGKRLNSHISKYL